MVPAGQALRHADLLLVRAGYGHPQAPDADESSISDVSELHLEPHLREGERGTLAINFSILYFKFVHKINHTHSHADSQSCTEIENF